MDDGMSPSDLYRAGGGRSTTPRLMALFAEADRGHERAKNRAVWDRERRNAEQDRLRAELAEITRPATAEEYRAWLAGYLACGGQITHTYDYPLSRADFVVPQPRIRAMYLPNLYGADSVNLIVPVGVTAKLATGFHGCPGHCNVYFMDGFRQVGGTVAIYADLAPAESDQPALGDGCVVEGEVVE